MPRPDPSFIPKTLQSGERRHGHGRGFFKGQIHRFQDNSAFIYAYIFSKASVAAFTENSISGLKLFFPPLQVEGHRVIRTSCISRLS